VRRDCPGGVVALTLAIRVGAVIIEIRVTGKQWTWDFTHMPSGVQESNSLTVPVHQPVRLIMSSADVLHSFFVPAFRVKRDVVPGMYTTLWFEATHVTGEDEPLTIFCAEYCGAPVGISAENSVARSTNHSSMLATLRVTTREGYAQHLGTVRVADENYLTQSIRAPQSQVVQGFTRANMPVYNPTENRRLALIAYIRSLAVEVTGASSEGPW
jgi:heme/copper-type cytochrome/quinol oxidase subunit 2